LSYRTLAENIIVAEIKQVPMYSFFAVRSSDEYDSIHKVWSISNSSEFPDKLVLLYVHTKGMFNVPKGSTAGRSLQNIHLTNTLFRNWSHILSSYAVRPNLDTAGLVPSCAGFVWFNFFWARASVSYCCTP
jgi:hypothetical protein